MKAKLSPGTIGQIQMKIEALERMIEDNRNSGSYDPADEGFMAARLDNLKAKINS